jgi:hypothetical protein
VGVLLLSRGPENAALTIGLLDCKPECVDHMVLTGACSAFTKVLTEGPMKVQAVDTWVVSELVANHPKCQDAFAQHNVSWLLIVQLIFETMQEHSKYSVMSKMFIHSIVMDNRNNISASCHPDLLDVGEHNVTRYPNATLSQSKNEMHSLLQTTMGAKSNVVVGNAHFLKVMLEFLVQSVIDLDIGLVYTNMRNTQVDSIFIATGEGRTQNVETTQCIHRLEAVNDGKGLHIAMTMPVIQVGKIAGMVESVG